MDMRGNKDTLGIWRILLISGLLLVGLARCATWEEQDYTGYYDSRGACLVCPGTDFMNNPSPTVGGGL
jgi:hypothetical protein